MNARMTSPKPARGSRWTYIPSQMEFCCSCGVGHPACWSFDAGAHGCDGCCSNGTFPGRKPSVGDLALCGAGTLGLITKAEKQQVEYPDGSKALAWVGEHLTTEKAPIGSPWSSRNPCVVGSILYLPAKPNLDWSKDVICLSAETRVTDWPRLKVSACQFVPVNVSRVNEILMRVMREIK